MCVGVPKHQHHKAGYSCLLNGIGDRTIRYIDLYINRNGQCQRATAVACRVPEASNIGKWNQTHHYGQTNR